MMTLVLCNPTGASVRGVHTGSTTHGRRGNCQGGGRLGSVGGYKEVVGDSEQIDWMDRTEQLWHTLQVEDKSLSGVERAQLRQLVEDYEDVFVLNDLELRRTEYASMCSTPVTALPFSNCFDGPRLHSTRGMVAEMLHKGMITLLKSPVWWSVLV